MSGLLRRRDEMVILGEPDGDALFFRGFTGFFHPDGEAVDLQLDFFTLGGPGRQGDRQAKAGADDDVGLEVEESARRADIPDLDLFPEFSAQGQFAGDDGRQGEGEAPFLSPGDFRRGGGADGRLAGLAGGAFLIMTVVLFVASKESRMAYKASWRRLCVSSLA